MGLEVQSLLRAGCLSGQPFLSGCCQCSLLGWQRSSSGSRQIRGALRRLTWENRLLDLKAAAYRLHVARLPGMGSSALIVDPFSWPLYTTLICR